MVLVLDIVCHTGAEFDACFGDVVVSVYIIIIIIKCIFIAQNRVMQLMR